MPHQSEGMTALIRLLDAMMANEPFVVSNDKGPCPVVIRLSEVGAKALAWHLQCYANIQNNDPRAIERGQPDC